MIKGFSKDKHYSTTPGAKTRPELEIRPMTQFIKDQDKSDLIGLEIGNLYGYNARNILDTLNIKKLFLVDPYLLYPGYLDITSPFAWHAEKVSNQKLEPFKDKIVRIKKKSGDAVNDVPDDLDFIYIDGNHAYGYVLEDIELYWPKVKKGGVFGGHDYYNEGPGRQVKKAVDEWVAKNNLKLYTGEVDWWVIKNAG